MSIEITHIRTSDDSKRHESIQSYKWRSLSDGETGASDKATLVGWIDDNGKAFVGSGPQRIPVGVIRPDRGTPYLRTYADGKWTNNLLSLPKF